MNQEQLNQEMETELEELGMDFRQAEVYYEYAKKGCVEAMYLLGKSDYIFDDIEPYEWLQQAAEQNHPKALSALGACYEMPKAVGGLDDEEKAILCYKKAAEMGEPGALYELGRFYSMGHHVERDEKKGVEYITQAAKLGNAQALWTLSYIYKEGNSVVEKDLEKALEYAQKAYTELL